MAKFQKGHKLAPGGKREGSGRKPDKVRIEIKELSGQYREEALERLAFWMKSDNARASVQAALALLERSDGKPIQPVMPSDDKGQWQPYSITVKIDDGKGK